jgi:hypothetical protein
MRPLEAKAALKRQSSRQFANERNEIRTRDEDRKTGLRERATDHEKNEVNEEVAARLTRVLTLNGHRLSILVVLTLWSNCEQRYVNRDAHKILRSGHSIGGRVVATTWLKTRCGTPI